ncbi:ATP-dependent DNA helicase UvrD/PcrA [Dehalococcoides mccartyi]|uniref:ATP-dependent helicase n=1 Tax=Dehalococcoides mccartyi TaxID=61435 RepID=UPI0015E67598|nr:ATP-dependent DNA helicase [Dehalococcoides mccartyi]MBA2084699.1 ATP-dependent DNA helicase UvrD/PcrA [Dehalococcoides mccartyi]
MPKRVVNKAPQDGMAKAINHREGNLQIIACAGSGKTETISRRIAGMVKDGIGPGSIVAFTFTDKAAEELRGRIRRRIQEICPGAKNTGDMFVGTIHSFCRMLLQKYEPLYATYDVIDEHQQFILIQRSFYDLGLQRFSTYVFDTISRFITACNIVREEEVPFDKLKKLEPDLAEAIASYQKLLNDRRLLDYSGILSEAVNLLRARPDVLAKVRADIQYVTVDEYQDVNPLQESLLRLICGPDRNLTVVGDDDQAIYQWRGTDVGNMLRFGKRYKNVTPANLEVNHRSTDGIIDLANCISAKVTKAMRLSKRMLEDDEHPKNSLPGEIGKASFGTQKEEAAFIVDRIQQLLGTEFVDRDGPRPLRLADFAVLYRSLKYAKPLIREIDRRRAAGEKLDYNVSGTNGLMERPECRAIMTVYCYLCDENDKSLAQDGDRFGITPCADNVKDAVSQAFGLKAKDAARVIKAIDSLKARIHDGKSHSLQAIYLEILEHIGIASKHTVDGENEGLFYNLAQLSKAIADFESVYGRVSPKQAKNFVRFMWNQGADTYQEGGKDDPTNVNAITIMTIHRAKGTEFPVVFLPCMTQDKFPSSMTGRSGRWLLPRDLFPAARYEGCADDEIRLFYVATTRSKRYLYMTHANQIEGLKRGCNTSVFFDIASCPAMQSGNSVKKPIKLPKVDGKPIGGDIETSISFSQLNSFLKCGWDYKFRHVFGFEPKLVEAIGYGEAVHAVLLAVHNDWKDGLKVSDKRLKDLVNQQLFLPYASPDAKETLRGAAYTQVRSYRDIKEKVSRRVRATEKEFEYVSEGAVIKGKIDLLESLDNPREVKVVDFKTERIEDKFSARHEIQLGIYADAALQSLDLKPVEVAIYSLPNQKELVRPVDAGIVQKSKKHVRDLVTSIKKRSYLAKPTVEHCKDCDFGRICHKKTKNLGD